MIMLLLDGLLELMQVNFVNLIWILPQAMDVLLDQFEDTQLGDSFYESRS